MPYSVIYSPSNSAKMKSMPAAILLVLAFTTSHGRQLPSFVQKCKLKDAGINDCLRNRMQEYSKYLETGIKEFKIPPLKNFTIPEMKLHLPWMNGTYKDSVYEPIAGYNIDSFSMDLDEGLIFVSASYPSISLTADYTLDGKLIQIPFHGEGVITSTVENITADITVTGKKILKKGKEYYEMEDVEFEFINHDIKSIYFSNLFGKNVLLTERINGAIFENRDELFEEFWPLLEVAMNDLFRHIFKGVFGRFSLNELFD